MGEAVEDRTWSMLTTKFLPWALFIRRENRVDNWRRGVLEFNFDLAEFYFPSAEIKCTMRTPERRRGIPGQGKHIECSAGFCTHNLHHLLDSVAIISRA